MKTLFESFALLIFALVAAQPALPAPVCAPAAGARSIPACMAKVNPASAACPASEQSASASCQQDCCGESLPENSVLSSIADAHRLDVIPVAALREQQYARKLTSDEVRALVARAKTPPEHRLLADYYAARADSDLAKIIEYQRMALIYRGSSSKFATGTVDHCASMTRQLKTHAAKMRKLQQLHEQMAWQAGQ